jgi:hypothetical protein
MTEPLAVRIITALDEMQRHAEDCAKVYPGPWELSDRGWMAKVTADEPSFRIVAELTQDDVARGEVEWLGDALAMIAAFDPSSVLRLITGMREIAAMHSDVMDDSHTGTCSCESDYPCETVRALAAMLGVEGT